MLGLANLHDHIMMIITMLQ